MQEKTHGVMFHHFHGENHPRGQGSISAETFAAMIVFLESNYSILNAREYMERLIAGRLAPKDICLTFDDALLCQVDIALPILREKKIEAFFFVYSSPLKGDPDFLEIYRHFRTTAYESIDDFYGEFFLFAEKRNKTLYREAVNSFDEATYLSAFPFYSTADRWFRYLRDLVLSKEDYASIMLLMFESKAYDPLQVLGKLWMSDSHVEILHKEGHLVGLHSYSHPTTLHTLTLEQQSAEYLDNYLHLQDVLGSPPISMSHPCGNYGAGTLDILKKMGIKIGFRSSLSTPDVVSNLEVPRQDHANVLVEMSK
ncbi:polysaccharide deacetylase family protein [Herbaspirillum sp. CF444]|uniref:polysaccharide deacetylase family protein n=1 Tax=Herbaspirillum sp. CF444 TaxID=1144319 RepID=UPI00192B394E|nr:polysaccharide deacetylase family protein [Herbaspirillum sp. CF444]